MYVQFTGVISNDPTIKEINGDKGTSHVAEFSLAESGKRRNGDDTKFHAVSVFGTVGEKGSLPLLTKGSLIEVQGNMTYNLSKKGEDGKQNKYYEIKANNFTKLRRAPGEEGSED